MHVLRDTSLFIIQFSIALAVSLSGRLILCGSDDNNVHVWDALKVQHNGK